MSGVFLVGKFSYIFYSIFNKLMQSNSTMHFGNVDLSWPKVWPHFTSLREGVMNWSKLKGKKYTYHFQPKDLDQLIISTSFPTSLLTREIFLILRSVNGNQVRKRFYWTLLQLQIPIQHDLHFISKHTLQITGKH